MHVLTKISNGNFSSKWQTDSTHADQRLPTRSRILEFHYLLLHYIHCVVLYIKWGYLVIFWSGIWVLKRFFSDWCSVCKIDNSFSSSSQKEWKFLVKQLFSNHDTFYQEETLTCWSSSSLKIISIKGLDVVNYSLDILFFFMREWIFVNHVFLQTLDNESWIKKTVSTAFLL
jgi:hypothetical protein